MLLRLSTLLLALGMALPALDVDDVYVHVTDNRGWIAQACAPEFGRHPSCDALPERTVILYPHALKMGADEFKNTIAHEAYHAALGRRSEVGAQAYACSVVWSETFCQRAVGHSTAR